MHERVIVLVALALIAGAGIGCKRKPAPAPASAEVAPTAAPAAPASPAAVPPVEIRPAKGPLGVLSLVTCRQVELREPVGVDTHFSPSVGQIWAHATVRSTDQSRAVIFRWRHDGETVQSLPVHVGHHPRWRTWSFLTTAGRPAGDWTVEVVDPVAADAPEGVMARAHFRIDGAAPPRRAGAAGEGSR